MHQSMAQRVLAAWSGPSMGCTKRCVKSSCSSAARSTSGCGTTTLSSLPLRWASGAVLLGLTQIQSMPAGAASVPLVSTAISVSYTHLTLPTIYSV